MQSTKEHSYIEVEIMSVGGQFHGMEVYAAVTAIQQCAASVGHLHWWVSGTAWKKRYVTQTDRHSSSDDSFHTVAAVALDHVIT